MSNRYLLFFLIFSFFFACTYKTSELHEHIAELTAEDLVSENADFIPLFDSLSVDNRIEINQIYADNAYKPIFISKKGVVNETGKIIQSLIENSLYYGIPQSRIYVPFENKDSLKNELVIFTKDVQLTIGFLRLLDDLKHGFSDSLKMQKRIFGLSETANLDAVKKMTNKQKIVDFVESFTSKNGHYQMLAQELKNHVDTLDVSLQLFKVPLSKKDTILSYISALKNLKLKNFPFDENENPKDVIKRFQKKVGISADGKINEPTKHSLEETPLDIAHRIAWAMEKTRYAPEILPKQFIRVNIPEFQLYYFNEDTIASIHNVVVGRLENNTPTLKSKINRIITLPYWNVPHKIATKEILPAVKANINYLERNQMEILRGDNVVDPHTVNWTKLNEKNFPYRVRQLPGVKNSLGIIKFEFYNPYDVYVHDTPQKALLNSPNRTYSHGCIRCKDPIELGKKILEINEKNVDKRFVADSLDSILARQEQNAIYIRKGIPIFVEYNTVAVTMVVKKEHKEKDKPDEYEEKVLYFRDVYFKDEEIGQFFFGKKSYAE